MCCEQLGGNSGRSTTDRLGSKTPMLVVGMSSGVAMVALGSVRMFATAALVMAYEE